MYCHYSVVMTDFVCLKYNSLLLLSPLFPFKGSCRTLGIYSCILYVNYKWVSSCWSAELDRTFYYASRLLIDRALRNDATSSLTTYTLVYVYNA